MSELIDTASVLAIKIDQFNSKLFLFDVVDDKYHLIASNETQTTAFTPFNDLREGVIRAIDKIEKISGRKLIDRDANLITPSSADGSGVDQIVITYGFLNQLNVISMGILEDVSLQSAKHLISMTHLKEIDQISLNDPRNFEELMGLFVNKRPNMILLAGGTENGATRSLSKLLDIIKFSVKSIPGEQRPALIYAGNSKLAKSIHSSFQEITKTYYVPNIRPSLDEENLTPALNKLSLITSDVLKQSLGGFQNLSSNVTTPPIPFSHALGIMTQFLGKLNDANSSVLTLHIDREASILAASSNDELKIDISTDLKNTNIAEHISPEFLRNLQLWSSHDVTNDDIKFSLWNKSLNPHSIPDTDNALHIETSILRYSIKKQLSRFLRENNNITPLFNQILVSGNIFSDLLSPQDTLLTILDSVQPEGISSIYLDTHGLLPALGTIAIENKILPVQIMESSAIALLAKVFSINSRARNGVQIAKVEVEFQDGTKSTANIRKGAIIKLPVLPGQVAKIHIQPLRSIKVDPLGRSFKKGLVVQGGLCGIVIDARGRPISLPKDSKRRKSLIKSWQKALK